MDVHVHRVLLQLQNYKAWIYMYSTQLVGGSSTAVIRVYMYVQCVL